MSAYEGSHKEKRPLSKNAPVSIATRADNSMPIWLTGSLT